METAERTLPMALPCALIESLNVQSAVTISEILPLSFNKGRNIALFCFWTLCITNECLQSRKTEDYFSVKHRAVPLHAVIYVTCFSTPEDAVESSKV